MLSVLIPAYNEASSVAVVVQDGPTGKAVLQFTLAALQSAATGRITGRVFNQIGITGYVPDVLKGITAVGDDFELTAGAWSTITGMR